MEILPIILKGLALYLGCGLLFAVAFAIKGIEKTDEAARGSSLGFRLLIIPGTLVFWPLLLRKWISSVKKAR
jgi:hypothetical protein